MKRFDRYLIGELLWPSLLATVIALFLLLANRFFRMAPLIVGAQIDVWEVVAALRHMIPPYLVSALPVAFYMAVIVVLHRMVRSGEWGALLAAGVSPLRATAVIPVFALLMVGWTEYTGWTLNPQGRVAFYEESKRLVNSSAHRALSPGVVHNLKGGLSVYLQDREGDRWEKPVFMIGKSGNQDQGWLLGAEYANVHYDQTTDNWQFVLYNGWGYNSLDQPYLSYQKLEMRASPFARKRKNLNAKERTLSQLAAVYNHSTGNFARDCLAEKHGRILLGVLAFFLPLAAIGLGLGDGKRRGGKGGSLFAGLIVFGLFYLVNSMGRKLGMSWTGPVWLPMYSAVGLFSLFCLRLYLRIR